MDQAQQCWWVIRFDYEQIKRLQCGEEHWPNQLCCQNRKDSLFLYLICSTYYKYKRRHSRPQRRSTLPSKMQIGHACVTHMRGMHVKINGSFLYSIVHIALNHTTNSAKDQSLPTDANLACCWLNYCDFGRSFKQNGKTKGKIWATPGLSHKEHSNYDFVINKLYVSIKIKEKSGLQKDMSAW